MHMLLIEIFSVVSGSCLDTFIVTVRVRVHIHEKVIISLGYTEVKKKHLIETKCFGFNEQP